MNECVNYKFAWTPSNRRRSYLVYCFLSNNNNKLTVRQSTHVSVVVGWVAARSCIHRRNETKTKTKEDDNARELKAATAAAAPIGVDTREKSHQLIMRNKFTTCVNSIVCVFTLSARSHIRVYKTTIISFILCGNEIFVCELFLQRCRPTRHRDSIIII